MITWKKKQELRLKALNDEIRRMNKALECGKIASFEEREAYIHPETGKEIVRMNTWYLSKAESINHGLLCVWLRLRVEPEPPSNLDVCFLANGDRWANMMSQVGEARNTMFNPCAIA